MHGKILFIGGTGQISLECVKQAVTLGHDVSVFNRGERTTLPDVRTIVGDYHDDATLAAVADEGWDAVCQFIGFTPAHVGRDLDAFRGNTGQYLFVSSASAYKKPVDTWPITEDVPLVNPYWEYSRLKAEAEAVIRGQDSVPWTIVRPSHTVRTHLPTALGEGWLAVDRMRRGAAIVVPGDGTSLWTLTRSEDLAVPFVRLLGNAKALGEAFHITADRAHTWDQVTHAIADAFGLKADIVHVPTETLMRFRPQWTGPLLGDKVQSVVFDNTKVKSVAGDFSCADTLPEILATPIALYQAGEIGGEPPNGELDALLDTIVAAQRLVGGAG